MYEPYNAKYMAYHNQLGRLGETIAADMLRSKGYEILHTNWHSGHYELDLVALKDNEIIFIEVKTRGSTRFELPEMSIDSRKIHRLVYAADHYIRYYNRPESPRFDVITIVKQKDGFEIKHIENAFYPPLS